MRSVHQSVHPCSIIGVLGVSAMWATSVAGQPCGPAWEPMTPGSRADHAMAMDSGRGRLVVFGGAASGHVDAEVDEKATWEWDGDRWELKALDGPSARVGSAMAYDAARGRVLLFGGDTWLWDGTSWAQRTFAAGQPRPAARTWHAMAYDSRRARVVLFGGSADRSTWEWDGESWTRVAQQGPPARRRHAMAYDPQRGVTVLFGGQDFRNGIAGAELADTWEWDGVAWTEAVTTAPGARSGHTMAFSGAAGRVILQGGVRGEDLLADVWTYGADGWRLEAAGPGPLQYAAMAGDEKTGDVLIFGGGVPTLQGGFWRLRDGVWELIGAHPARRAQNAGAADTGRGKVVMCGEVGSWPNDEHMETWEWDGRTWKEIAAPGPLDRWHHSMTYDVARDKVRLTGGAWDGAYRGDQWEWDGDRWTSVNANGPDARSSSGMTYDEARDRVVLTGGIGRSSEARTWEFDGAVWRSLPTPPALSRWGHAQAYDPVRRRTVLVGGYNGTARLAETWEWDGAQWRWVASDEDPVHPSARSGSGIAFEPVTEGVLLFGGTTGSGYLNDTWLWRDGRWTQAAAGGPPLWRTEFMVADPTLGHVVAYIDSNLWGWKEREHPRLSGVPSVVNLRAGRMGTVSIMARGTLPLRFEWTGSGGTIVDDTHRQGATSSSLMFLPAELSDAGVYLARVWNTCGSVTSEAIEVRVFCGADLDQSGVIDSADFFAFVSAFLVEDPAADFDSSGSIDTTDFFAFLTEFFQGCD